MAWSLADKFSMSSVASSRVFSFIFPPAEASSNFLVCGLNPSMNIFSWIGSENPWVGVLLSKSLNLSNASLKDLSGNWWNEDIVVFPSVVLDSGKYLSQPTLQREGDAGAHGCVFHGRKMRWVATNVYSRKILEKLERCGLWTLSVKGSGVVFTHGEGISTPRVRHKGRQPLTKCGISCLRFCFIFPFLCFCVFLYFLSSCGRQGYFPRSYVSSITMRKSDLRSSLRTKRWLSCFYLFSQEKFQPNKSRLRRWTIKRSFDFERRETLRRWTINDLLGCLTNAVKLHIDFIFFWTVHV